MEIADETEAAGCKKLGLVMGNSYWGGFYRQQLSLDVQKKRAWIMPRPKAQTRVLWLKQEKRIFWRLGFR